MQQLVGLFVMFAVLKPHYNLRLKLIVYIELIENDNHLRHSAYTATTNLKKHIYVYKKVISV